MATPGDSRHAELTVSRGFRAERSEALYRVLRRLPDDFLGALVEGLDGADVVVPGKLFAGDRGGCAVGVALRVLEPGLRGRWVMWGRSRSILGFRKCLARRVPYLYAFEQVFDRSVVLAWDRSPGVPPEQVVTAVARWVADEARAELALREVQASFSSTETSSSPELAIATSRPLIPSNSPMALPIGASPTA